MKSLFIRSVIERCNEEEIEYYLEFLGNSRIAGAFFMVLKFNEYQIDTRNFTLSFLGQLIDVEPTMFKIMAYLIENRSKIVTREEIFTEIWSDKCVSDSALSNHIKSIRKILGDDGNRQLMIKTIHRRGYQFVCEVKELTSKMVMVLPLTNTKPCSKTDYYGAAVSHQIVAVLSKASDLTICLGNFSYCSVLSIDEQINKIKSDQIDYVLTGNYIEFNGLIRMNVELIELKNNSICWLESIELESSSIFALQDLVASKVILGVTRKLNINLQPNSFSIAEIRGVGYQPHCEDVLNQKPHLQLL